jgi:hypothetical protein
MDFQPRGLEAPGLPVPNVAFWIAWNANTLAGFGALNELDAKHRKVKSMRVAPTLQGVQTTPDDPQRWLGKTEQGDEWSFCLMATRMVANRRDDEQETTPESQPGI